MSLDRRATGTIQQNGGMDCSSVLTHAHYTRSDFFFPRKRTRHPLLLVFLQTCPSYMYQRIFAKTPLPSGPGTACSDTHSELGFFALFLLLHFGLHLFLPTSSFSPVIDFSRFFCEKKQHTQTRAGRLRNGYGRGKEGERKGTGNGNRNQERSPLVQYNSSSSSKHFP